MAADGEKDRTARNDMNNLQLVEHVHSLTSQIAQLQAQVSESHALVRPTAADGLINSTAAAAAAAAAVRAGS